MIKAILFDLDGTLIDTETLYHKFYPIAFNHYGYDIKDEQVLAMRSLGKPYCYETVKEWFGPKCDLDSIKKYRNQLMDEHISKYGIKIKKGMKEALSWLKDNGYNVVLTTACDHKTAVFRLKKVDIDQYLNHIVCANDVKYGKPAPDTYLKAIKYLNLNPAEAIGVEDSPNGVRSAYSAGLNVVMIPDQTKPDDELLKYDIKIVNDGYELIELIKNWK